MTHRKALAVAFAAITLTVLIASAPAVAQSDEKLAVFEGSVSESDGTPVPDDTEIYAVTEDGDEDFATVTNGEYGNAPGLTVSSESNTTDVVFYAVTPSGSEVDPVDEDRRVENVSLVDGSDESGASKTHDLTFSAGTFDTDSDSDDTGSSDDNDDSGGAGGGGGGQGGGAGGGGGGADEADSGPPSVSEVHSRLNFVTPTTETTVGPSESASDSGGPVVEPTDTSTVSRIEFQNPDLSGETKIVEYGDPPALVERDIKHSASQYIDDLDVTTEDGEVRSSTDIVSLTDIEPTAEATADQSATVELRVPKERVDEPSNLGLIKEEYVYSEQSTQWVQVDTEVESQADAYVVTGTVDKFSLFAVTEEEGPSDASNSSENDEPKNTTNQAPGFGLLTAIMALSVGAAGLRLSRRS